MSRRLRIAQVAPVATSVPPARSSSVELFTSLLTEGLAARGHEVTLFATGASHTTGGLHATFGRGYGEDLSLWPWELCELMNVAAAVERADDFDLIHYQAMSWPVSLPLTRLSPVPLLQTVHHAPGPEEVALWARYPDAPFVAISGQQASLLAGLNVVATIHHGLDMAAFRFARAPQDYLLFLGRFVDGKGVLPAIEVARRTGRKLILAAAENEYYRTTVAPHVDGRQIVYAGEVEHDAKVSLLGGAQALLYPVQAGEPFGLVLAEAMACGTPVAALDRGAVREIVEPGVTGGVFASLAELEAGLPGVIALDRALVRARAAERFGLGRMLDAYVSLYERIADRRRPRTQRRPAVAAIAGIGS